MDKILLIKVDELIGISLEDVIKNKIFRSICKAITYPKCNLEIFKKRVNALKKVGIDSLFFEGRTQIGNICVLGKGTNSIVIKAFYKGEITVLKVLRLDSPRNNLDMEARLLKLVSSEYRDYRIVPKIYLNSDWYLVMEHISGKNINDFLNDDVYIMSKEEIKKLLTKIFFKAYLLDRLRIDHTELSRAKSHIIIEEDTYEPLFIDFESAKIKRKPHNLTSVVQAILIRHPSSEYLRDILSVSHHKIIKFLKTYSPTIEQEIFMYRLENFLKN